MAVVVVGANKRFSLTADTTTTLQFSTDNDISIDKLIMRKIGAGNCSYMVNAAEADLTAVPQADANTLTDAYPARDLYKPNGMYHIVVRSDADMVIELDTERVPKNQTPA